VSERARGNPTKSIAARTEGHAREQNKIKANEDTAEDGNYNASIHQGNDDEAEKWNRRSEMHDCQWLWHG
jgi:hypothetical protein